MTSVSAYLPFVRRPFGITLITLFLLYGGVKLNADCSHLLPTVGDMVIVNGASCVDSVSYPVLEQFTESSDWHYNAPQPPKFVFLAPNGGVAMGLGAYLKGTLQYDFDGSIPDNGSFLPGNIPIPANPADKNAFNGTVNYSLLYLRLVGKSRKFGNYGVYIETQFSGGPNYNQFFVRQAWASLGYLRIGLATSIFDDEDAYPFTIDEEGPVSASCSENLGIQWTPRFGKNKQWTAAIGLEVPKVSYTITSDYASECSQRVPDLPIFLQYSWDERESRVRLSAILRNLAYRDELLAQTKLVTGWGMALSGAISPCNNTKLFYNCMYGRGINQYINDFSDNGYDLISVGDESGQLRTPNTFAYYIGAQYNFTPSLFVSGVYSYSRLFNQASLGSDAYKYGQYAAINAIYSPINRMDVGIEYLWGRRVNIGHLSNHANRIAVMVAYSL